MPSAAPPPTPPPSLLSRLARTMVARRRLVVVAWIAILALAIVGGPKIAGAWSVDYSTPGSDSHAVNTAMSDHFPDASYQTMPFAFRAAGGVKSAAAQAQATKVLAQLDRIEGVGTAKVSQARISQDGTIGLISIPLELEGSDIATHHGHDLVEIAEAASTPQTTVRLGGQIMAEAERGEISSEGVGLSVALIILLLTFGSIVAAGLPIAVALFGVGTGIALVGGVAALVDTPDWAVSVATMVGIGVGIDYALLVLTRHRASLAAGASVVDSIAGALATAGRSVVVAGGTVVISMLGLLLMGLPYLQGVALSASASVLVVMLASLTLLPALLGFAGHRINALTIGLPGGKARSARREAARQANLGTLPSDASPRFAAWSRAVQRRPAIWAIVGLVLVAVIASPVAGVRLGYPGPANDPVGSQSRDAYNLMTRGFGAGAGGPMYVTVPLAGGDVAPAEALRTTIEGTTGVQVVQPLSKSPDGTTALFSVQPRFSSETPGADRLLKTLRDDVIPPSGASAAKVGGFTAETHDQSVATASRLPILFLAVAGLSALLLLAAFRSVLVPVKAAALNVISIAAAYGVVAVVAEGGTIGQLVGVSGEAPIPPFIPVLMFAILFGLSMDYEVFLLGRIRERWLEHGDASRAVTDGVAATGRVITAAAAIMIAVFGAFALSDQLFLKLIGIGMASAVLIDATLIRLLLVPAFMELMGERAWWIPRWLDRLVPEAELEAPSTGVAGPRREPVGAGALAVESLAPTPAAAAEPTPANASA
ncbi:MAG: MMPL family transporter [Solirubrobacteraceae bacterium]|nr:MMPL family transporter [Solirubrobacteraceae bacterium]